MGRRAALSLLVVLSVASIFGIIVARSIQRGHDDFATAPTRKDLLDLRGRIWSAQEAGASDPIERVAEELESGEEEQAGGTHRELLRQYAVYRERARAFAALSLPDRLQALKKLRREVFGEELAGSLFGEDERMAEFVIRRGEILKDPALSAEEKRVREERLKEDIFGDDVEEAFPTDWLQYYEKTVMEVEQNPEVSGPEKEKMLDSLREGLFGKEAADRLKAVEVEQKSRQASESGVWAGLEEIENVPLSAEEREQRRSALQGSLPDEEWQRLLGRFRLHQSSQPPPPAK